MEMLEFDLARMERELTLQNYERVVPEAEKLLAQGYAPARLAAIMFQYGYLFGRKLLKDHQKERRLAKWETIHQAKDDENESRTSGENEGSM